MKWLIEPDVFHNDEAPLIEALQRLGVAHTVTKLGKGYEEYAAEAPDETVFHGSFQFAKVMRSHKPWFKGLYCTLPKLNCLYYYPRFGNVMINRDYVMLPFGELNRRRDWLMQTVGKDDSVFIRPATGDKCFTGKVVKTETWEKDIKLLGFYDVTPEELVIVARPAKILKEWRCIVVNNKIVAASQYKANGADVRIAETPGYVLEFGRAVVDAVKYQPDPAWTLDLGELENEIGVVEVGSFSCAGFYAADPEPIIMAVGDLFR